MIRRDIRRRLEQYAANPGCEANALSAVHDIPMDQVARSLGLNVKVGQSVFAIQRGHTFEHSLFLEDAQRLRRALIDKKVLPANASGFFDLRSASNGGPLPSLDRSYTEFRDLLRRAAASTGEHRLQLPTILAGPSLVVPGKAIPSEGLFAIDVVTLHPQPRPTPIVLRIGEIKVYPDRGGFTDPSELSSSRAQAGLYVHVLKAEIARLGLQQQLVVADDGFLVLTRPGSNLPSLRAGEDLRYQSERAAAAFAHLGAIARALPLDAEGEVVPASRIAAVQEAKKSYADGCLAFCELADHCQAVALSLGIPSALGEDMGRFLGELSLHRALELLHGAAPLSPAEEDFLRRTT